MSERSPLVPLVLAVLAALAALYLAHRLGWLKHRALRWIGGIAAAVAIAAVLPYDGVPFRYLKRLAFLIASATSVLLLLEHWRIGWTLDRRRMLRVYTAIAIAAVVSYLNFFSFHGQRTFVHLHDVAHYYLGSKYHAELGYTDLYTAMLRAEAELHADRFKAVEVRDLTTYERLHIRAVLQRSDPVKAAFTPERWTDFQRDVDFFRQRLGPRQYQKLLLDHGFNPTPAWTLLGGALSRQVPAGSGTGILLLTLFDPLLLVGLFAAIAWAFGRRTLVLSLIFFSVVFGAGFGWTGGAFLRFPWLFGVVVGFCCLHKKRYAAGGALFAVAASLRLFPLFFLLPLAARAVTVAWRRRSLPPRYRALFGSALATAGLLFALTATLPRGWGHWEEFRANTSNQLQNIAPNVVGLTQVLAFRGAGGKVTAEEFAALKERRTRIYRGQLLIVLLPLSLWVARRAGRWRDTTAAAAGLPLLFAGLNLASYYYACLLVLVAVHRRRPDRLALIFAVEAAPYLLMLFEHREGALFVYRSLALAFLFVALAIDERSGRSRLVPA